MLLEPVSIVLVIGPDASGCILPFELRLCGLGGFARNPVTRMFLHPKNYTPV
jgi:hypothetical protein